MEIAIGVALIVAILLIGFLSGIEIAFIASNKLSIELSKQQGKKSGKIWAGYVGKPGAFFSSLLVALNFFLVLYGLLIGRILNPVWQKIKSHLPAVAADYMVYIQLLVVTLLAASIILLVIFIFRAYFRARSNSIVSNYFWAILTNFFYTVFLGTSRFLVQAGKWILSVLFNVKLKEKTEMFNRADLELFIAQNNGIQLDDTSNINQTLFENALSLSTVRLRTCLVPRKEIISIPANASIEEVKEKFIKTQLSKLVVYEDNIDNIIGYIHQLDLFKKPASLSEILLTIPIAPETMSATDLMDKFTKERKTIAWVVDEFGGTAGIVTMEDLLEEIFGDIKDEYDIVDEFVEKQLAENEYLFSGRLELDYLAEKYDLHFEPEEQIETLSGFIIQSNEGIPKEKQRVIVGRNEFTIISVSDTRIETVKLKLLK